MSLFTLSYAKMIQSLIALTIWLSTYVKLYQKGIINVSFYIIDTFQTMSNYKELNVFMYVNVTNQ